MQFETEDGHRYMQVRDGAIISLESKPDLTDAKKLTVEEVRSDSHMKPMPAMEPMKPMKPLEPL